jgi:chaperonin GroEL
MNTTIKFNNEAREALKRGVDAVANAVKVSLGAEGRNVIFPVQVGTSYSYIISKDGVSIAKSISPRDEYERIGAEVVKEAARRTNSQAGDGTTTATVLAQSIFEKGLNLLSSSDNISSVELKRGIDQATKDIVAYLDKVSKKVSKSDLESVATISANGDTELGKIIAKAFNKIGKHGTVVTAVSDTSDTYVELRDGVQLDRGFYHQNFITNKVKDICELDQPFVLLHKGKLEKGDAIVSLFSAVFSQPKNTLLIIADDVDPFVLSTILENVKKGAIAGKICLVKTPQILKIEKDLMNDISVLTGATVVSDVEGVKLRPEVLGRLSKCVISEKDSLLVGNADNLIGLVSELKEKISATKNQFDKLELQERLSRITGGVATLYVGAKSDSELKEKQDRVEDSINATRSALEEGIVAGGGVALDNAASSLMSVSPVELSAFEAGYHIVLESCSAPARQICDNAGREYCSYNSEGYGINVKTGEFVNMIEEGIIDPKKVTRCALENAASVAGTFLTTEAVVTVER